MKILLIGTLDSWENKEIKIQAEKMGHSLIHASIKDFVFKMSRNRFKILHNGKDIAENLDLCLIRGISPYFAIAKTVAKYLDFKKITVLDRNMYSKVYEFNKLFMTYQLAEKNIPLVNTYYFENLNDLMENKKDLDFPMIIKDIVGMHGRNIYFFNKQKELIKFFSKKKNRINDYILQKEIFSDHYYRVFVIGNRALGAMKRATLKAIGEKKLELNERSEKSELSEEYLKLAVKSARANDCDIAGVDMIFDENKVLRILEVNRTPKFKQFTHKMGINVAKEIVKYLEKIS